MSKQNDLLEKYYAGASQGKATSFIEDDSLRTKLEFICRCNSNKAPVRFLLSCLLAKIDIPTVDIRKPYTEIAGTGDKFSGRFYDETYVQGFIHKYGLPVNPTTAYLTPAFRNIDRVLDMDLVLVGRPREVYTYTLEILHALHSEQITPEDTLQEILRFLIIIKEENQERMKQLLADLEQSQDVLPLSSEEIITLLVQHMSSKNASRIPVLIVSAAYTAVGDRLGEGAMPLEAHNAADKQTGSLGDVEITLTSDDKIITCYEMKDKRVTKDDIHVAIQKLKSCKSKLDNYIFITTDVIEQDVLDYAATLYEKTGVEFAILDCIGFIRHYLHFFHRSRISFLNIYQELVLAEPTSSVSQPLKELFLALRRAAEADRESGLKTG